MKTGHTDITVVLDTSGSMSSTKRATIDGMNTFVEAQKEVPGEATFSLVLFNSDMVNNPKIETIQDAVPIKNAILLNTEAYKPEGGTPLLDAMGSTILKVGSRLSSMREEDRPEKVIFIVNTDGYENTSKEFSGEQISSMVKEQTEKYKWEFVFLGANQDAVLAGKGLGMAAANSMTYAQTSGGISSAYETLTQNSIKYRSNASETMAVSISQRNSAVEGRHTI